MKHNTFEQDELRVALARRRKTRVQLAAELNVPYSTAIGWLTGRHPAPPEFRRRVEAALGVRHGALRPKKAATR